ncbi:protein of unknown function (plasmid) [Pararobbsia alpina]
MFKAIVCLADGEHQFEFEEHQHEHEHEHVCAEPAANRDHNIRSAYSHVIADAAVFVPATIGVVLAQEFGAVWMNPLAGVIDALVIANRS